ncbi:class I SAM-dependent methyltransferase [Taibaiella koreensis]|uniref:class I SAM-dependent methyltransferase n=1 Tax=Taibaiella koreensis TaxID=1268548 RepID=UPI000E59AA19|nr:class I SAM-dependent methyltransferase [Taibaiella koreensis]
MATFKDYFSRQAAIYAQHRPAYPEALFTYLASLSPAQDLAWDCGCGNGQSALGLAAHFSSVYASDPSAEQINHATAHSRITYRIEPAEHCSLPDRSADLVTVAQALHWFRFEDFFAEVRRVLKPGGVLAVWIYGLPQLSPELDRLIRHFHDDVVGAYWQYENRLIENGYADIAFPFEPLPTPAFSASRNLTREALSGLLYSWSAVQRFREHEGYDPVAGIQEELTALWPQAEAQRQAVWPLTLIAGIPGSRR